MVQRLVGLQLLQDGKSERCVPSGRECAFHSRHDDISICSVPRSVWIILSVFLVSRVSDTRGNPSPCLRAQVGKSQDLGT
uniref:Uncharacterized protein n=1 Tax=Callorhinchus milii TaxID=7868 RepID=A0A4W3JWN4_CALMI